MMFTLIVNGVPALKLQNKSEIPSRRGQESWLVVDEQGNTIDIYSPPESAKRSSKTSTRIGSRISVSPELAAVH